MADDDEYDFRYHRYRPRKGAGAARDSDPHTSHGAAASITPKRMGEMKLLVLRAARYQGDKGVNWFEAEEIIKKKTKELPRQSISNRLSELCDEGYLERRFNSAGEEYTRPGKWNKPQIVNWITPAGLALLKIKGF